MEIVPENAPQTVTGPALQEVAVGPAQVSEVASPSKTSLALWMRDVIISVAASVLIITFLYQPVRVEGTSMLPRLENHDRLFINKFVYRIAPINRRSEDGRGRKEV